MLQKKYSKDRSRISTESQYADRTKELFEEEGLTRRQQREEIFMALEALCDRNLSSPADLFRKRYGFTVLSEVTRREAGIRFRNYLNGKEADREISSPLYRSVQYHSLDNLLANTCSDPIYIGPISEAMMHKGANMLSRDIGYEDEIVITDDGHRQVISAEKQIVSDFRRLHNILGYIRMEDRISYINDFSGPLQQRSGFKGSFADRYLFDYENLKNTLIRIEKGIKGRQDLMKDYISDVRLMITGMSADSTMMHPALSPAAGIEAPDGKVVIRPMIACDYDTGMPFEGFAQYMMQVHMAADPLCHTSGDGSNRCYMVRTSRVPDLPAPSRIHEANVSKIYEVLMEEKEKKEIIRYAEKESYIPSACVSVQKIGHGRKYFTLLNGSRKVTRIIADAADAQNPERYFTKYMAAAKLGVSFETTREIQKAVLDRMASKEMLIKLAGQDRDNAWNMFARIDSGSQELIRTITDRIAGYEQQSGIASEPEGQAEQSLPAVSAGMEVDSEIEELTGMLQPADISLEQTVQENHKDKGKGGIE